jgi:mannose-6-phosphate isomerase-like protein (cupin superfamily)
MTCREVRSWLTIGRDEWAPGHFVWPLLDREDLSVSMGAIPAEGGFAPNRHPKSRQFLFILEGAASVEVEGEVVRLAAQEGLEVVPGEHHWVENPGEGCLLYLLVSVPG